MLSSTSWFQSWNGINAVRRLTHIRLHIHILFFFTDHMIKIDEII